MSNIHEFNDHVDEMLAAEQKKYDDAVNEKIIYEELRAEAARKEKEAKATIKQLERAKIRADKANETEVVTERVVKEDKTSETERVILTEDNANDSEVVYVKERSTKKSGNGIAGFVMGAAAVLLLIGGWKFYKESKTGDVKLVPKSNTNDTTQDTPNENTAYVGGIEYNYNNNEVVVTPALEETTSEVPVVTEEEVIAVVSEEDVFTTEKFETLVADYANKYAEEYKIVSTADIAKFGVIANIDILAEQNPELIATVANGQTKEEFLNDAAKLIGATVMNNFQVWNETKSTEKFIRVSDIVYGPQKEQMLKIEEYTDRIADAVNAGDKDLVNQIVSEFLTDLNSGSLSKLDDGVGFVAQVNIAMISDGIARNYLNKENFDMLQVLKTSEKYVSNIFTVYSRCTEDAKTRTR